MTMNWLPRTGVRRRGQTVRKTVRLFKPYRWRVALLVGLVAISVAAELLPALTLGLLVGEAVNGLTGEADPDLNKIVVYFAISVGLYSLAAGLSVVITYIEGTIGQGVMYDLRAAMHAHLNRLSIHFFTSTHTGEILSRVSTDVNMVQNSISMAFTNLITHVLTLTFALALMVYLDWRLSLIAAIVLVVWLFPMWKVGLRMQELQRRWQEEAADMSTHLEETLSVSGMMMVRSFGRQDYEAERFRETNETLRRLAIRRMMANRWLYLATRLFGSVSLAVVYWWGARGMIDGSLAISEVVAYALITQRVFGPFSAMTQVNTVLIGSLALFRRIFEYLDQAVDIEERADAIQLTHPVGVVEFDDVTFAYAASDDPALEHISFKFEPGQMAALVGPSGAGKTTITYLLQRFYDPAEGRILLDGHNLRDVTFDSISRAVGVVMQDTTLFFKSLRDNIRYGRLDASDAEVEAAARAAGLADLIDDLDQGLDTTVGARGYRLSGGEQQRVAIARAILKDPAVLILDEATASLDSRLEAAIRDATARLAEGRTTIVVAHRLSTVIAADVILVVDGGRIVERGTHAELLARGGLYATLYHSQFAESRQELEALQAARRNIS